MADSRLASGTTPTVSSDTAGQLDRRGLTATVCAFLIWGLLPLYLWPLRALPAVEIMAHRIVWSCVLVCGWLGLRGGLRDVHRALANAAVRRRLLLSAALISCNWLGFVWAAGHGRVLDASLGYFINPLINVLLGVVVLSERLSRARWAAVAIAGAGVVWLGVAAGAVPWIAFVLALSFSTYGFIRKLLQVEAVVGLAAETVLLLPFALGYLLWVQLHGQAALGAGTPFVSVWLMLSGLVTGVPLSLFAFGARRIPYSTVGLIQYLSPSLNFVSGIFILGEPFDRVRLGGFTLIWLALIVFAGEQWRRPTPTSP